MNQYFMDFEKNSVLYYRKKVEIKTPILHCAFLVKRGSLHDYIPGTAHCLEHMMIENQIVDNLDWKLVNRWAHTDFYNTTFFFVVDVKNFEYVNGVIKNIMNGIGMCKQEFDRIKTHVIEECLNRKEENIKNYLFEKSAYFMKSPVGNVEALLDLQYRDIEQFYLKHYLNKNYVFLATGNLECFESINGSKIHIGEYYSKNSVVCYPLAFGNDIYNMGIDNINIYFNTQINQEALFGKIEVFLLNMQIVVECLRLILKEELRDGMEIVNCRLMKFSIGFYLIHIEIVDNDRRFRLKPNEIINRIKDINWVKYKDLIKNIIDMYKRKFSKREGTNLGEILVEAESEVLYEKNFYNGSKDAIFDVESTIECLNDFGILYKYRIIV